MSIASIDRRNDLHRLDLYRFDRDVLAKRAGGPGLDCGDFLDGVHAPDHATEYRIAGTSA